MRLFKVVANWTKEQRSIVCFVGVLGLREEGLWKSTVGVHLAQQILNIHILFLGRLLFVLIELGYFFATDF